jgi:hypothetical protein
MDLVDLAILALRLALVLVLYLFLWLVVRSAWHALRTTPERESTRSTSGRESSRPAAAPAAPRAPAVPAAAPVPVPAAARPASALRLLVLEPGESALPPGEVIELADGATLGRADRSSLVVADSAVSAEHARFALLDGEWVVADLGSTNGTLVNQALVQGEAALEPGDVVSLGKVRLKVVSRAS